MIYGSSQRDRFCRVVSLAAFVVLVAGMVSEAVPLQAQLPPGHRGTVATGLLLRQLDGVKRVLMIGAHPDDEDTGTLAALARGMGVRTAYLSLTRGEGGQNLIGTEFGEGLGIIRSNELVAARAIDGGEQFFTRAIDFGFSKSAQETLSKWPREEILADVVWTVRRFRPHVIVSVFSGTPRDGHGQHQVAGMLAHEAFDAAADPGRFPEQLGNGIEVWQAAKLYQARARLGERITATLETGVFDPLLARSYHQLAMASRSQHRSQDMGAPEPMGSRRSVLALVKTADGVGDGEGGLFAGVDTTFAGLVAQGGSPTPESRADIEEYRAAVTAASASLDAFAPQESAPALVRALQALERIGERISGGQGEVADVLAYRRGLLRSALLASASLWMQVRADDDMVVPGESFDVRVELWNGGPFRLEGAGPELRIPAGWSAELQEGRTITTAGFGRLRSSLTTVSGTSETLAPGEIRRWLFRVRVPSDARLSRRYYLPAPDSGEIHAWPPGRELHGLPHDPPVLSGITRFDVLVEGAPAPPAGRGVRHRVEAEAEARYYGVDPALGEFTRALLVVPAVSVSVAPEQMAWPLSDSGESRSMRAVTVRVRNEAKTGVTGELVLEAPGWSVDPASAPVELAAPGRERSYTFNVAPGVERDAGTGRLLATLHSGDRSWSEHVEIIDYPHIERAARFRPAELRTSVFSVAAPPDRRIGYIMGTGDSGAEALASLGFEVELLDAAAVLEGDFARFDALVLGVRAYQARPDLAAANESVLDFARSGGTVVVQYNQYDFPASGYAPYPVSISRPHDRITDEGAAVGVLHPEAPVLVTPNRITEADFEGWVQERGLYFLTTWDSAFTPLLSMADPGEAPKEGALLIAPLGEGVYIYTGLSFFRQFPAGVPGAYRLFANMVSLDGSAWRDYLASEQEAARQPAPRHPPGPS